MNSVQNMPFLTLLWQINWLNYGIAVTVVYALGVLWYSPVLFGPRWTKLAHAHPHKTFVPKLGVLPMVVQFGATAVLGFALFMGVLVSLPLTILFLITTALWQKASIFFKYPKLATFISVALIEIGYFLLASTLFFVFAMIS